ncbi:MAG: proton-conducting transporter membrane subunit, partial [Dehalococcoidia bacterium]
MNENDNIAELLRWIALLPLIAATFHGIVLGLVRWPAPRWLTIALSCGSVGLAFVLSCVVMGQLLALPEGSRFLVDPLYTWIASGSEAEAFRAQLAFALDPISAVMILIVTGVGLLIHVYSIGYMDDDQREDRGFQRFFCYLNLFSFSMLMLVLGDNLLVLFVGWEGVGLCSYLLIGFWFLEDHNAMCGQKAFVV